VATGPIKEFDDIFSPLDTIHEHDGRRDRRTDRKIDRQTDRQTDRHRATAETALTHTVAVVW